MITKLCIISKVVATGINKVIITRLDSNQCSSCKGRHIHEGILVANEWVDVYCKIRNKRLLLNSTWKRHMLTRIF